MSSVSIIGAYNTKFGAFVEKNKETGEVHFEEVSLLKDEGNRPQTTLDALSGLRLVNEGGTITAGNASQLSDAASACVLMDSKVNENELIKVNSNYLRGTLTTSLPNLIQTRSGNVGPPAP